MKVKPVVPRELASRDIREAVAYYLSEATAQAALGFIDALEQAYAHVGHGTPRRAPLATPMNSTCQAYAHGR